MIVDGGTDPVDEESCAIALAADKLGVKSVKAILVQNEYDPD